jgi:hypothetical protein
MAERFHTVSISQKGSLQVSSVEVDRDDLLLDLADHVFEVAEVTGTELEIVLELIRDFADTAILGSSLQHRAIFIVVTED